MTRKIVLFLFLFLLLGLTLAASLWFVSKAKSWQLTGEIVYKAETTEKIVALTFDDGPSSDETDEILQILDEADIKATFYINGNQMVLHREAAPKMVAAGHELGNHGYTHRRMVLRSEEDLRSELERTDELIRLAGHKGPITFRPPFGQKLVSLPKLLKDMNKVNVMWSLDPMANGNWSAKASHFSSYTIENAKPGD